MKEMIAVIVTIRGCLRELSKISDDERLIQAYDLLKDMDTLMCRDER